jgi:tight adherence protein B
VILLVPALAALGLLLLYEGLTGGVGGRPAGAFAAAERLAHDSAIPSLTGLRLVGFSAAAALVTFLVLAGATASLIPAVAFAAGASVAPFAVARSRANKRRSALREAWPDALAGLIASVRAGVSLPESCSSLAERGPHALRAGWRAFNATYRSSGSFSAALGRLQDELADPVADRVAAALRLAHEVGGTDLVRVLRTLGDFVREDLRVRKEIEARWSWTVTAARVACAAPWIVLALMSTRPEAAVAYNSAAGALVVASGAGATLLGYRAMLRAARLPEERRLRT